MSHSQETRETISILPLEPKRILSTRHRQGFLPRTWKDALYAAMSLFFLSLSAPGFVLAWRLWGGHW